MLKQHLLRQLQKKLRDEAVDADNLALQTANEAKSGSQRAINMAKGTRVRALEVRQNYDSVNQFQIKPLPKGEKIQLGSIVELEDGVSGKTVFIAPAGAGLELTGPGDDGFFYVVTPASPIGKHILGKRVGDSFELPIAESLVEYTITHAE